MSLTLFQNITSELTDLEKEKFVPMLIDTLLYTHDENRNYREKYLRLVQGLWLPSNRSAPSKDGELYPCAGSHEGDG
jgi:hypothetical protein